MELSEYIASINCRQAMRNGCPDNLLDNTFSLSPSNDKLMDFFLGQFEKQKVLYERNMHRLTGNVLCCDHTFKTSKYIGITRDDGKFVRQFENLFIGINEKGEVLIWRFTKSTAGSEVIDLLQELKKRQDNAGQTLEMIVVDDCCHSAGL